MLRRSTDASDYENLEKIVKDMKCQERYEISNHQFSSHLPHAKNTFGGKCQEEDIYILHALL
jgi:hypothetical protein